MKYGLILLFAFQVHAQDLETILDTGSEVKAGEATQKLEYNAASQWFFKKFPNANSFQMETGQQIRQGVWDAALLTWGQAVNGTALETSASGKAFEAFLMFRAGIPIVGLESLWTVNPQNIDSEVKALWKEAAPLNHPAWTAAQLNNGKAWTPVFGEGIESLFHLKSLSPKTPIAELTRVVTGSPPGSELQGKAQWNLILAYALADQAGPAAKMLALLMKSPHPGVSMDLMNITAGRLLYQNGYFEAAIKYYQKVPKSSDLWLAAQEELAWTHLRKGEPQNAVATTVGLTHPGFIGLVGPEVDLVKSMGYLKVCDYSEVLKTLKSYSGRYKDRYARLNSLAKQTDQASTQDLLQKLEQARPTAKNLGEGLKMLPRFVLGDNNLYDIAQVRSELRREMAQAEKIYGKSLALTGLQGKFDTLKKNLAQRLDANKAAALSRVQSLAKQEVGEIESVLRKLHIVEAEVIQQISMADRLAKTTNGNAINKKGTTVAKAADTLSFPMDGELWFDEISYANVDVKKGCVIR